MRVKVEAQGEDTYGIDELETTALSQVIIQQLHGIATMCTKVVANPLTSPLFIYIPIEPVTTEDSSHLLAPAYDERRLFAASRIA